MNQPQSARRHAVILRPDQVPTAGPTRAQIEWQIFALVASGRSDAEISARLELSLSAVKARGKKICRRLGARNRAHAVHLAHRAGILDRSPNARVAP